MIELPEWVQNAMGAKPGDTLIWTIDEDKGCVTLKKRADDFFDGEGVTDDLMNERDQPPDQDR
ncbi:hypothetical protein [Pseudomonas panipatensis]|uniref:Uncharacterized protein n=2 Tax=Pseudomonas panipatensis TaxID=428992 RepID=A0A1G8N7M1_9PSED|nr:hypothetical protein [Pseudomonas panipatensis]SDI76105.1 hypothetical protein SAMN05216272_1219 [Pseudomonas panipatensis]SMP45510.1 hypothetical protein SAMN06295951_101987 [Pseudomonas panipatensis]